MRAPPELHGLVKKLPVPIRRLAYRGAYQGLRLYWILRAPSTSGVKCLLTQGEQVLLVRHTYGPREWDLPGGSIGPGESPETAARREMNEELGVAIHELTPLGDLVIDAYRRQDHVHYFGAELRSPRLHIERGELATVRWFSRRQLPPDVGHYVRAIIGTLPPVE